MHGFAAESGGVDVFEHLGGPELQYDVQAVDTRSRATEGAMIGHRGKPHKNSAQGLYDLQIRSKLPTAREIIAPSKHALEIGCGRHAHRRRHDMWACGSP